MLETVHLLSPSSFPSVTRGKIKTLQVNLGLQCNQSCLHCHVNAGPNRQEMMDRQTVETVLDYLNSGAVQTLDLTGGAPELNPLFRHLVQGAVAAGVHVMDRCNLTVLKEPGQEGLAEFLAGNRVEVMASLPCYLQENVDAQRGNGVFSNSIEGLKLLNEVGYGDPDSGLLLNLVYNPQGPSLPPSQQVLEADYKQQLDERYGIRFNQLYTLTNMPIQRFGSMLLSRGEFDSYLHLLKGAFQATNLESIMCRSLVSVDWRGYLYDCDFNQMLGIPMTDTKGKPLYIHDLRQMDISGLEVKVAEHCYGCTAGQGSSCGGALG